MKIEDRLVEFEDAVVALAELEQRVAVIEEGLELARRRTGAEGTGRRR